MSTIQNSNPQRRQRATRSAAYTCRNGLNPNCRAGYAASSSNAVTPRKVIVNWPTRPQIGRTFKAMPAFRARHTTKRQKSKCQQSTEIQVQSFLLYLLPSLSLRVLGNPQRPKFPNPLQREGSRRGICSGQFLTLLRSCHVSFQHQTGMRHVAASRPSNESPHSIQTPSGSGG